MKRSWRRDEGEENRRQGSGRIEARQRPQPGECKRPIRGQKLLGRRVGASEKRDGDWNERLLRRSWSATKGWLSVLGCFPQAGCVDEAQSGKIKVSLVAAAAASGGKAVESRGQGRTDIKVTVSVARNGFRERCSCCLPFRTVRCIKMTF